MPAKTDIGALADLLGLVAKKKKREAPKKKKKKSPVTEFSDTTDFVMTMLMISLMHANPGKKPEDVIEEAREWAREIWMPSKKHIWRKQAIRISRVGVRAEASKIRREMFKLL